MILLKECNTVVKRMSKKLPCCERRLRLFGVKTLNGRTLVGINHYGRTAACDGIYSTDELLASLGTSTWSLFT